MVRKKSKLGNKIHSRTRLLNWRVLQIKPVLEKKKREKDHAINGYLGGTQPVQPQL